MGGFGLSIDNRWSSVMTWRTQSNSPHTLTYFTLRLATRGMIVGEWIWRHFLTLGSNALRRLSTPADAWQRICAQCKYTGVRSRCRHTNTNASTCGKRRGGGCFWWCIVFFRLNFIHYSTLRSILKRDITPHLNITMSINQVVCQPRLVTKTNWFCFRSGQYTGLSSSDNIAHRLF